MWHNEESLKVVSKLQMFISLSLLMWDININTQRFIILKNVASSHFSIRWLEWRGWQVNSFLYGVCPQSWVLCHWAKESFSSCSTLQHKGQIEGMAVRLRTSEALSPLNSSLVIWFSWTANSLRSPGDPVFFHFTIIESTELHCRAKALQLVL